MDLENEEAMNFTKALIGKYMDFFAARLRSLTTVQTNTLMMLPTLKAGTIKNTTISMASLLSTPNTLAAMAKERGLQPMAFNDGFYYEDKDDVEFDKGCHHLFTGLKDGGAITL